MGVPGEARDQKRRRRKRRGVGALENEEKSSGGNREGRGRRGETKASV